MPIEYEQQQHASTAVPAEPFGNNGAACVTTPYNTVPSRAFIPDAGSRVHAVDLLCRTKKTK